MVSEFNETNLAITATSATQFQKSKLIRKKNVIVESPKTNNAAFFVAISDDDSGAQTYAFEPVGIGEAKQYRAKRGKLVCYLLFYAPYGQQYVNYFAADGMISRPLNQAVIPSDSTTTKILDIIQGLDFTERWEQGFFDRTKYFGRTGPFFLSDGNIADSSKWVTPIWAGAINTNQTAPNNNAIQMQNSKDGVAVDQVYFSVPKAFKGARLRFDALLPTTAQIGATGAIGMGFECNSQGGSAILELVGWTSKYQLRAVYTALDGSTVTETTDLTLPHTNAWSEYHLIWLPPTLYLYEYSSGWNLIGSLTLSKFANAEWLTPFFCNESTAVLSNFYLGNISVHAIDVPANPAGYVLSVANTQVQIVIRTQGATQLDLWLTHSGGGTPSGTGTVECSVDGTTYFTADSISLAAATQTRHYGENHLCTTMQAGVNPALWPFVRVTLPAQGSSVVGMIAWVLK